MGFCATRAKRKSWYDLPVMTLSFASKPDLLCCINKVSEQIGLWDVQKFAAMYMTYAFTLGCGPCSNREAMITDRNISILDIHTVPSGDLLDMLDPNAEAKRFPDVCGAQAPATFQFLPATGEPGFS